MTIADEIDWSGFPANEFRVGADRGPTIPQWAAVATILISISLSVYLWPATALVVVHHSVVAGFVFSATSKLILTAIGRRPQPPAPRLRRDHLPSYTLLVPLYREAAVVDQLIEAMSALDYPRDRLQAVLLLEADDSETLDALAWLRLPRFIEVLVKPPGGPRTKPNALNAGLRVASGELIAVYDAEDLPDPGQLRRAAERFSGERDVACLQAPLRISNASAGFLQRQFALEYAGQFDAVLPGLARIGAPFPLGGTSNHFRGLM